MGSFRMFEKKQPLDRTLPLVMSLLVLATVGLFAWLGYWQFGDHLYANAGQRLATGADLVSNMVAQSAPRWRTQLEEIAHDRAVIGFLKSGEGRAQAETALDRSNPARTRGRWRARLLD